ncbi:MAG TPA: UbiA family prenyltransferase, partial [Rubrobacter sp.]|nr:UbiA family prenyltransferase [Rubrobacter sp.]
FWRLLRYRVAVTIVLFMLLGTAWHGGPTAIDGSIILMVVALASSYVSATSVNDIADKEIDEINHPGDRGRPLVTGAAKTADLWVIFGVSSVLAVALSLVVSQVAAGIMLLSVVIGALYSLPPVALSHRTFLAPLTLAVAYVGIPYSTGVVVVEERLQIFDLPLVAALYLLFAGRIILKDFRDREGDGAHGKQTFLLEYGKKATCLVSLGTICAGDALLVASLAGSWWLAALLQPYVASIIFMLRRLHRASSRKDEQLSIGVGAKMGNGLLATLLGVLILANQNAGWITQATFGLALTALYMLNLIGFLRHPDQALIGYKG